MSSFNLAVHCDCVVARVVRDVERFANVVTVLRNLLLGFGEGAGYEVKWLHRADGEGQVVLRDFVGVKRLQLGHVCHAVGKFAHTGEDAGSIGLCLAILLAHAKLDREPVDGG